MTGCATGTRGRWKEGLFGSRARRTKEKDPEGPYRLCGGRRAGGDLPGYATPEDPRTQTTASQACLPASHPPGLPWFAGTTSVSYTHLRAHETDSYLVCRL